MLRRRSSSVWRPTGSKALFVILIAAFATRMLPLSISQYPFNNDSLVECVLASSILDSRYLDVSTGALWYTTHNGATPAMNVVLAFVSSVLGTTPLQCAQVLVSILSVLTVGCVFLLGRQISGGLRGGIASSFAAILMGTFAFVTGSAWKEMMGIALLVLLLVAYLHRDQMKFRLLMFVLLILMPLVHHLVALVALLLVAYLLCWSWFFAFANGMPKRRHLEDLAVTGTSVVWAVAYYSAISFDRISLVSSPMKLVVFGISFIVISMVAIMVLTVRTHSKRTYAPFAGIGLIAILTLDYFGFFFPYTPSATYAYFFLIASSGFLLALAWYGTEVIVERRPLFRAVQIALIVSPLSILGYGLASGFSPVSFQIVYRTFDFVDIFIFLGIGTAFVWLYENRRKSYAAIGYLTVVFLLISFPFAYASDSLLGVRHDTQAYEVDSLRWLSEHVNSPFLESDERIGHIAEGMVGIEKHAALPDALKRNVTVTDLPVISICLVEDSWTTEGVNDFPHGKIVLPASNYTWVLESADVIYIGGPVSDRAVMFTISGVGFSPVHSLGE